MNFTQGISWSKWCSVWWISRSLSLGPNPFGTFTLLLPCASIFPVHGTPVPRGVLGQQMFQFLHPSFQGVAVFNLVFVGLVVREIPLVFLGLLSCFSRDGHMFLLHGQVGMRALPTMRPGRPIASSLIVMRFLPIPFMDLPFCQPTGRLVGLF